MLTYEATTCVCVCVCVSQHGIRAASSTTQPAVQLVVHRVYEQLVAALAQKEVTQDAVSNGTVLRV